VDITKKFIKFVGAVISMKGKNINFLSLIMG